MSSSSFDSIPLNPRAAALLYGLLLAQQSTDKDDEDEEHGSTSSPMPMPMPMPMPVPVTSSQSSLPVSAEGLQHDTGNTAPNPHPPMPKPSTFNTPTSGVGGATQNPAASPSRPPSPTASDVATTSFAWKLHTLPLFARLGEQLYGSEKTIPPPTAGCIGYLKLDGCSSRDTTEVMCALIQFLQDHRWEEQSVDVFIATMRPKPYWPKKLENAPDEAHVKHVWSIVEGLLAIFAFGDYLSPSPPHTFHGIVTRIFPDLPDTTTSYFFRMSSRVVCPQHFSFSIRDLLEEDLIIQPSNNMVDHLKLIGNVVKVFILDSPSVRLLMNYNENRGAQAIGMANLGNEILQSYQALTESEFQENFKLPISLGMFKVDPESAKHGFDDLTVVTGIIRLFHKHPDFDPKPHLLASRVHAIETALRNRRHWYMRLRRDIHKRKKEEPWMFWGAVLAVFFGICTVIQTVTSVWSLVVAASS